MAQTRNVRSGIALFSMFFGAGCGLAAYYYYGRPYLRARRMHRTEDEIKEFLARKQTKIDEQTENIESKTWNLLSIKNWFLLFSISAKDSSNSNVFSVFFSWLSLNGNLKVCYLLNVVAIMVAFMVACIHIKNQTYRKFAKRPQQIRKYKFKIRGI